MSREINNIIAYEAFGTGRIYGRWTNKDDEDILKMNFEAIKNFVDKPGRIEYRSLTDYQANAPHRSGKNYAYLFTVDNRWQTYREPLKTQISGIPPRVEPQINNQ